MPDLENIANISMWVVALREPDRKQITGQLHGDKGMCCLGVACSIAPLQQLGIVPRQHSRDDGDGYFVAYSGMTGTLPFSIRRWLGFEDGNPYLQIPEWLQYKVDWFHKTSASATRLNDNYHFSFAEISDCIVHTFDLEESLGYVTKP